MVNLALRAPRRFLIPRFDKAILSKLIKDTFADWNRAEFVDVSLVAPASGLFLRAVKSLQKTAG